MKCLLYKKEFHFEKIFALFDSSQWLKDLLKLFQAERLTEWAEILLFHKCQNSFFLYHFFSTITYHRVYIIQFHFRCLSDSLFHRHDILWDPSVFSRSSHWSISGIRRNDFGGTAVSPFERRWNSNYVPGVFLGYLLLCYYSLDIFLHDCNFYSHPRTSMGYLR